MSLYIVQSSFAVRALSHVSGTKYILSHQFFQLSSFSEICVSLLVTFHASQSEGPAAVCCSWTNSDNNSKKLQKPGRSFPHLFAVHTHKEEKGIPSGSSQVWMVKGMHTYPYTAKPNLWIFRADDLGFHPVTAEEGMEGKGACQRPWRVLLRLHPLSASPSLVLHLNPLALNPVIFL